MPALELRPYQTEALDALNRYLAEESGQPIVVLPTASGKSLILSEFIRQQMADSGNRRRFLILTHVKELIEQDYKELMHLWPWAPAGIYSAGLNKRQTSFPITFAGIQSVHDKAERFHIPDYVLIDECFVLGTMISTLTGEQPIETLIPGDFVLNALGVGRIEATKGHESQDLWKVRLSNGTTITCTGNHPFYTEKGWVQASLLETGRRLYRTEDLSTLRSHFPALDKAGCDWSSNFSDETKSMGEAEILYNFMLKKTRECYVRSCGQSEDESHPKSHRPSPQNKRRERNRTNRSTARISQDLRRWLDTRVCHTNEDQTREWVPNLLQAGSGKSSAKNGDRIRGSIPLQRTQNTRQKERCSAEFVRVESVSRSEQRGSQTVYNLQVSGHPSYFAGGVLVHNCHLTPRKSNTMYRRFLDALRGRNPDFRVIGLTATHYRLDSGLLTEGDDRVFTDVAYEVSVRRLIDEGYLCKLVSKKPHTEYDLAGVHTRGGEFVAGELEAAMDQEQLTAAALEDLHRRPARTETEANPQPRSPRRATDVGCGLVTNAYNARIWGVCRGEFQRSPQNRNILPPVS